MQAGSANRDNGESKNAEIVSQAVVESEDDAEEGVDMRADFVSPRKGQQESKKKVLSIY